MPPTQPNPIVRVLPSLTDFAFLMPLVFLFTKMDGAKSLLGDGDTGWHIRTGEWILANGRVPHTDIFSFTKPGQPWFAWEWLSDVMFAWLHQHWGLAGVVLLGMLILCATSTLLFRLVSRRCSNPLIAIGFTVVAMAASSTHWHARPHLFTLLFVVIFLHVLERVQSGRTRLLWALPPLTLLWTNLHGGFFVGMFLIGCYAIGELAKWFIDNDESVRRAALVRAGQYGIAVAACGAVSLVNPYSYHLHLFIVQYLHAPFLDYISEFRTPNFREPGAWTFELMLFAGIGLAMWSVMRRRFADVLIVVAWAHLALFAVRNVSLFGMVCAPIAARSVNEILAWISQANLANRLRRMVTEFSDLASEFGGLDAAWRVHAVSVLAIGLLAFLMVRTSAPGKFSAQFDADHFPVKAVAELQKRPVMPRLFTEDQWGDYLIYRMYPTVRVFMDGRSDFYGGAFVTQYVNVLNVAPGWQADLERYGIESILLPVESPLVGALKQGSSWRPVYDDHKAILFDKIASGRAEQVSTAARQGEDRDRRIAEYSGGAPKVTANYHPDLRINHPKPL